MKIKRVKRGKKPVSRNVYVRDLSGINLLRVIILNLKSLIRNKYFAFRNNPLEYLHQTMPRNSCFSFNLFLIRSLHLCILFIHFTPLLLSYNSSSLVFVSLCLMFSFFIQHILHSLPVSSIQCSFSFASFQPLKRNISS